MYVKNPQKELMELSDLLVSAGSRTLFDLVFVEIFAVFFAKRYSLTSQLVSRELSNEISSTHQESERGCVLSNWHFLHQGAKRS